MSDVVEEIRSGRRLAGLSWEEFEALPAHIQDLHEAAQMLANMRIYEDPDDQEAAVQVVVAEVLERLERVRDRGK